MNPGRSFATALRAGATLGATALLLVAGECGPKARGGRPLDWESLKKAIRKDYPDVAQIGTDALASLVERGESFVLLDAREPAEFAVSRIEGARNLRSVREVQAGKISKEERIVLYCSVGYRSSALAAKLMKAGYGNVANLEGSIFAWANEGRPVVGPDGARTTRVHPYSERWGALLDGRVVEKAEK